AGIADYFDWKVKWVRIAMIIATIYSPPVMIVAYVLMSWLIDPKPVSAPAPSADEFDVKLSMHLSAADRATSSMRSTFAGVRDRFGSLEQRLRSIEARVTSREFQMDRELRRTP
ncbi:MAG: PspC domain-containing protein, partial [Rhodobacteraceae bacterium]|nr:PspC domain-containing protein [Paracoccaceae bacterium]